MIGCLHEPDAECSHLECAVAETALLWAAGRDEVLEASVSLDRPGRLTVAMRLEPQLEYINVTITSAPRES